MNKYINDFINDRKSYCSDKTILYYTENLKKFSSWLDKNEINVSDLSAGVLKDYILDLRGTGVKNTSCNTYYRAVKVFCKWLYNKNVFSDDITLNIKQPRNDADIVRPLLINEAALCDQVFLSGIENGLRNFCIFHLMLDCGLRRQEVINLHFSDVSENYITIRNTKFNKSRVVLLPAFLYKSINNYAAGQYNMFLDRHYKEQITINTIRKIFANLKKQSGVVRVHPHLLRHTFATSYLYNGGNMEMLRLLLGHADYNITQNYLHLVAQEQLIGSDIYQIDDIFFKNKNKR